MYIGANLRTGKDDMQPALEIYLREEMESVRITSKKTVYQDRYDFADIEEQLRLWLQHDVKDILLNVGVREFNNPERCPEILGMPERLPMDQNGVTVPLQGFRNFNFNNPELRETWSEYIKQFGETAERVMQEFPDKSPEITVCFCNELHYTPGTSIVTRPAVPGEEYDFHKEEVHHGFTRLRPYFRPELGIVGDLSPKLHLTDASKYSTAKYRKYLAKRYSGDIAELNRRHAANWRSFEEVSIPSGQPFEDDKLNPAWMEWLYFRFEDIRELYEWVQSQLPAWNITNNFVAVRYQWSVPFSALDMWRIGKTLNDMGIDYPDIMDYHALRSVTEDIIVGEASIGYTAPYMYRQTLLSAIGGARSFDLWQTSMDFVNKRYEAWAGVKQAKPFCDHLTGRPTRSRTAVLFSNAASLAMLATGEQKIVPPSQLNDDGGDELARMTRLISNNAGLQYHTNNYEASICSAMAASMEHGDGPDIIGEIFLEDGSVNDYNMLIIPNLIALSDIAAENLDKFTGGVFAYGVNWGSVDELANPRMSTETVFKVRRVRTENTPDTIQLGGITIQIDRYDIFEPLEGAEIIAVDSAGNCVGVKYGNRVLVGFSPLIPVGFGIFDNLAREIFDYSGFINNNAGNCLECWNKLADMAGFSPVITSNSRPHGVWHSFLKTDNGIQIAFYDYADWRELWDKQRDPAICEPIEKLTQPRCYRIIDPRGEAAFAPVKKDFNLRIAVGDEYNGATLKVLKDSGCKPVEVASGGEVKDGFLKIDVQDMEFIYIIDLIK